MQISILVNMIFVSYWTQSGVYHKNENTVGFLFVMKNIIVKSLFLLSVHMDRHIQFTHITTAFTSRCENTPTVPP